MSLFHSADFREFITLHIFHSFRYYQMIFGTPVGGEGEDYDYDYGCEWLNAMAKSD